MSACAGIGTLTSQLLVHLARTIDRCSPAEAARLSTAALEVLACRLAHELDAMDSVAPETHRRALLTHIHAFIWVIRAGVAGAGRTGALRWGPRHGSRG